jgi:hypothetical protein
MRELRLLVAGDWVDGAEHPVTLVSPATGEAVASVHQGSREQLDRAVDGAWPAHRELARMTAFERAALTHRVADLLAERAEDVARDLSAEHGKPLATEARPEVAAAVERYRAGDHAAALTPDAAPRATRALAAAEAKHLAGAPRAVPAVRASEKPHHPRCFRLIQGGPNIDPSSTRIKAFAARICPVSGRAGGQESGNLRAVKEIAGRPVGRVIAPWPRETR